MNGIRQAYHNAIRLIIIILLSKIIIVSLGQIIIIMGYKGVSEVSDTP